MKTFLKKVWYWLKYSSTNAAEISTTFKGMATLIAPVILLVLKAYKPDIDDTLINRAIEGLASLIIVIGGLVGALMTAYGAVVKIWTTFNGTNEVIASFKK